MKCVCPMNGVHCRNGALNEIGRTPAERLKICKNMHVADMDASEAAQIFVNLRPRSARLICCKALAVVLVHGVKILVQWQRCVHNHLAVGIVSADKDWRLVGAAEFLQSGGKPHMPQALQQQRNSHASRKCGCTATRYKCSSTCCARK